MIATNCFVRWMAFGSLLAVDAVRAHSQLSAPPTELYSSSSDLTVGTFFGSNWVQVEAEARKNVVDSIEVLQQRCRVSAPENIAKGIYPLSCGLERATYCGFNPRDSSTGVLDQIMFFETFGASRHMFSDCREMDGLGCQLEACISDCIEFSPDSFLAASVSCQDAVDVVRDEVNRLVKMEGVFDLYEIEFRQNVINISLLSALASLLVVYLSAHMPKRDEKTSCCTHFCVILNWIAAIMMIGFVAVACPIFLVVILPPFGIVQVLCYLYYATSPESIQAEDDETPCQYQLLQNDEEPSTQPTVLTPVIYSGVPLQVV